jgi:hypothetical protein
MAVSPIYDKWQGHACPDAQLPTINMNGCVYHNGKKFSCGQQFPLKCVPIGNSGKSCVPIKTDIFKNAISGGTA